MESASSEDLRRYLRELFALAMLPAVWARSEVAHTAANLSQVVQRTLNVELVFVSLRDGSGAHQAVQAGDGSKVAPERIAATLAPLIESGVATARIELLGREMNLLVHPLIVAGAASDLGVVVAAASRPDFPRSLDSTLLRVAANHATVALQNASYLAELREAANTREALLEELAATSRRKDEFLAVLGHELRNPLAAIQAAHAQSVKGAGGDRAAEIISHQLTTLTRLVDDLLEISRVTTGKLTLQTATVDLRAVIDNALSGCRAAASRKEQKLLAATGDQPLWVEGDAVRLEQVVVNVVGNAVRYTPSGGRVSVTASSAANGDAIVQVTDDGCGIAPELLPRIFEPFVQADTSLHRSQGGLGLGLALVKGIVDLHGGSVAVTSPGQEQGCTVTLRVPLAAPPAKVAAPLTSASTGRTLRVLFVDDNVDMTEMLLMLVDELGHDAKAAADGHQGIELATTFSPHVAFVDIGLPGLDGFEVGSRLRSSLPRDVVLISMSGYGQDQDYRRSRAAGFDHHFVKPVPIDTLEAVLARIAASG
jgi:signal transduction histidine kinase/CheY-like chemotaxis protein